MDAEKSEVPETQKQEETVVEKAVKVEMTEDPTEPENRPAAAEEAEPQAVNGQAADVASTKETGEPATLENKEVTVEDKSDDAPEPSGGVVAAAPESAESPEKVASSDSKPEGSERQPVPENIPEPLQTQQMASTPEPEPKKPAEPEEKSLPVPVETEPPIVLEKAPEQVKFEDELHAKGDSTREKVVSSEKPAEAEAQVGSGDSAENQKEDEPEPATQTEAKAVKSEQKDAEPPKEENVAPAAGSLSFAILEQEETKDALRISRTLVVLRGLPGSGKSFLARAIADAYKDQCSVCSADQHGVKPENPKSSANGYKALDDAVVALCSDGNASSVLVVVDDTNHTHDRLACMGEIAKEHDLITLFLEPQTEWSRDSTQLKGKTGRGLEEAQLEAMKGPLEETSLPLFYGWFLLSSVRERVKCTAMDFLKTLDTLEEFKNHLAEFTGKAEMEVDLEQYFDAKTALHCTTKFCNYGKADGAKEYSQDSAVIKSYGSVSELSLTALFITPRTVGARVSLTEEQLRLWPADGEKGAESVAPEAASLPPGSRAHVTLGCADGVESVQTGVDLLQILALQQPEAAKEMELGSLRYFGEGRWMLDLKEPIRALACFSSFYGRREVKPTKKENEKKKKLKCAIL